MIQVKRLFQQRSKEIRTQLRFLQSISGGTNVALIAVEKSVLILMLYNLAEGTVRQTLESLHSEIAQNGVDFYSACEELQTLQALMITNRLRKANDRTISEYFVEFAQDLAAKQTLMFGLDGVQEIISGNVDGGAVRKIAQLYGINLSVRPIARGGYWLDIIKGRRNELGHGVYSLEEIGRNYSLLDIRGMFTEVRVFLRDFLRSAEQYLFKKEYMGPTI